MNTIANYLTSLRIFIAPFIVFSLCLKTTSGNFWGFFLYFFACLTDYFDGFYAKFFKETSSFGAFLDPLADKILVLSILGTLVGLHQLKGIHLIPVILIVFRELMIFILRSFLNFKFEDLKALPIARWKTAFQMVALGAFLYPLESSKIFFFGLCVFWTSAFLSVLSGFFYLRQSWSFLTKKCK